MQKRKDTTRAATFEHIARLLSRFARNKENPRDRAMASVYSRTLDRRNTSAG